MEGVSFLVGAFAVVHSRTGSEKETWKRENSLKLKTGVEWRVQ
jgi:hypothetical protein